MHQLMIGDVLRDPVWQFAGALVGAAAILVSLSIAKTQHRKKRITYSRRSTQLLSVDAKIRDRIEVLYEGNPVKNLQLSEFRIKSAGTVPIIPIDFVKPIEFFFGANAHVLSAKVASTEPGDIGAEIRWSGDSSGFPDVRRVRIQPLLLNPGDSITIQCLVAESQQSEVVGRIAGVKSPEIERDRASVRLFFLSGVISGMLSSAGAYWVGGHVLGRRLTILAPLLLAFLGLGGWLWLKRSRVIDRPPNEGAAGGGQDRAAPERQSRYAAQGRAPGKRGGGP